MLEGREKTTDKTINNSQSEMLGKFRAFHFFVFLSSSIMVSIKIVYFRKELIMRRFKNIDTEGLMNFCAIAGIGISALYVVGYFVRSLKK